MSFGDRLAAQVAARESQIVLGLDPDPARLWPDAAGAIPASGTPAELAAAAVTAHCAALIDAAAPACVAFKPQLACFERLGAPGWTRSDRHRRARARGRAARDRSTPSAATSTCPPPPTPRRSLGSTPTPFGDVEGLGADAVTVNPLLGARLARAVRRRRPRERRRAVRPRAHLEPRRGGRPGPAGSRDGDRSGSASRRSSASSASRAPVAASRTSAPSSARPRPSTSHALRELMPAAPFLLPGHRRAGRPREDLAPAFAPGRAGGLVSASRCIARAHETDRSTHARPRRRVPRPSACGALHGRWS